MRKRLLIASRWVGIGYSRPVRTTFRSACALAAISPFPFQRENTCLLRRRDMNAGNAVLD